MANPLSAPCPDCLSPEDVNCRSSYGDIVHAERQRIADLRALEQGTCALCGALLVRGAVDGLPVDVWHPYPADQVCPPLPDPRTDWNDYALALQRGLKPGHPGPEHFQPLQPTLPEVMGTLGVETLADVNEDNLADLLLAAARDQQAGAMCPECRDGKCRNCVGTALHPVTDALVSCACTHGGEA